MRAVSGLAFLIAALALVVWQAPDWAPQSLQLEKMSIALTDGFERSLVTMSALAAGEPGQLALPDWLAIGAGCSLALIVGFTLVLRGRANKNLNEANWVNIARELAPKTALAKEYLRTCDALSKKLAPDIEQRGKAALARSHQLDLYWRFVGRNRTSRNGEAEGIEYQRWVATTRATLKAVALMPEARFFSVFQNMRSAVSFLGGPPSSNVKGFYDRLAECLGTYEAAWLTAYGELSKPQINRDAVLVAMEKLRRLNRQIAEDAAALNGPISIDVRVVN